MSILDTFVTLDIETTGLNPRSSELIEIAAVRVVDGQIEERLHTYARPVGDIPDEISRLIGVSKSDLADAPRWANAAGGPTTATPLRNPTSPPQSRATLPSSQSSPGTATPTRRSPAPIS